SALRLDLLDRLAEGERFRLSEDVGQEHVVVSAQRGHPLSEGDEVARDESRALVDQLIKRVLPVGPGLPPVDRSGVVVDVATLERHMLAVTLHGELLEVGGKALQILLIRQHCDGLGAEEIGVPDTEKAEQYRQVALEGRCPEMLVHLSKTVKHGAENGGGDSEPPTQ